MMRLGLRHFLMQEPDLEICGEAATATEAISAIERLSPELVLLDIGLEGRSGLDLLRDLKVRFPGLPSLVHSMHDEMTFAERALQAGARGYLMKQETGNKIVVALRAVLRGEIYVSERLRGKRLRTGRTQKAHGETPIGRLTPREFEVFGLIGKGRTNREIAEGLHLSLKTVEAHREHMKRKLNVASSTALNLIAVRWESEQAF